MRREELHDEREPSWRTAGSCRPSVPCPGSGRSRPGSHRRSPRSVAATPRAESRTATGASSRRPQCVPCLRGTASPGHAILECESRISRSMVVPERWQPTMKMGEAGSAAGPPLPPGRPHPAGLHAGSRSAVSAWPARARRAAKLPFAGAAFAPESLVPGAPLEPFARWDGVYIAVSAAAAASADDRSCRPGRSPRAWPRGGAPGGSRRRPRR